MDVDTQLLTGPGASPMKTSGCFWIYYIFAWSNNIHHLITQCGEKYFFFFFACLKASDSHWYFFFLLWCEEHDIFNNCHFFVLFMIVEASLPPFCIYK